MPRPQPIIVPSYGNMGGMSGKQKETSVDVRVDLDAILDFFKKRKAREAELKAAQEFNIPNAEGINPQTLQSMLSEATEGRNLAREAERRETGGEISPVAMNIPYGAQTTDPLATAMGGRSLSDHWRPVPPPQEKIAAWRNAAMTEAGRKSMKDELYPEKVKETTPTTMEAVIAGKMARGEITKEEGIEQFKALKEKEEKQLTPSYKIIADKTSSTGFSYQDMNNPNDVRKNAPPPRAGAEINIGFGGTSKATQTKLEGEIIDADTKIESFDEVEKLYKPEYLTYGGKAQAGLEGLAEKVGIPINTGFLGERATWKQQSMTAFLEWRKWVTGVSGGQEELKQIAKSFPDPEKNSPTEFIANLNQARKTTKKLRNRLIMFRALGIEKPTAEQLGQFPLNTIPDNDIPDILPKSKQPVSPQSQQGTQININEMTNEELLEILGRE